MARGEKAARGSLTSSQHQRESGGSVFPACAATQAPTAARSAWGHPHGASRALPQPFQFSLEINPKPRCPHWGSADPFPHPFPAHHLQKLIGRCRGPAHPSTPLLSPILPAHPEGCQHLPSAFVQTHKTPKTFLSLLLPLPLFLSLILNSRLRSA